MADRNIRIAQELDLTSGEGRLAEAKGGEATYQQKKAELQVQLPGRVAGEQVLRLQYIGGHKKRNEDQNAAEIDGLRRRQSFQFITKSLGSLVHDSVRETGCGADGSAEGIPRFGNQQECDRTS